jgi:hypothetical protein
MNGPACPRCQVEMVAEVQQPRATEVIGLRVGNPPPPRPELKIWRCSMCGIVRPRLD